MQEIALHVLDIVENSICAGASEITVGVLIDEKKDLLTVIIEDNGKGMSKEVITRATDPFYTQKSGKKVGLGLSLFAQSARESGGALTIRSQPHAGTIVKALFQLSHPDRKPLGNVVETMDLLRASHPDIEFHTRIDAQHHIF